ncbi:MAG: glycosyltransferase family 1 protein [Parachlamydiales bacterium]|nr:glycosyltransferase family 1 protein [Parachlamydiales bacterium]
MPSVALLTAPIDFLEYYTQQIADSLERLEFDTQIISIDDGRMREHLDRLFKNPPDCFFSVTTINCDPMLVNDSSPMLCDLVNKPYYCYQLDPAWQINHLINSQNTHLIHIDKDYCDFVSPVLPRTYFLPFGVDDQLNGNLEKTNEIVFFGSCFDYEAMEECGEKKFGLEILKCLKDVAKTCLLSPDLKIGSILLEKLGDTPNFLNQISFVESYMRAIERIELVKALYPLPMTIYGHSFVMNGSTAKKGWKDYLRDFPNVTVKQSISYAESLEVMKSSKIVLNSSPHFRKGFHDRILNAIACLATCVTNDTEYIRSHFPKGLIYYKYGEWEKLKNEVSDVLNQDRRSESDALRQILMENHSWQKRMEHFVSSIWKH